MAEEFKTKPVFIGAWPDVKDAQHYYQLGRNAIKAQGALPTPEKPGQMMQLKYNPYTGHHEVWHHTEVSHSNLSEEQFGNTGTGSQPVYKKETKK